MCNYRIQPNYHTMCFGFSKLLGKVVVKYISTSIKATLKNQQRIYVTMLMQGFCVFVFF